MKIYFRYLFVRLLVPFVVCLCACTLIWIMADLYGNIDDFLENKINILVILRFYSLQIPIMLVTVLPPALLFSTLWTLLSLNRRCELVALQSGGMAPIWLFTPFLAFACILVVVLTFDLNWPAAKAVVTRDRLLEQVKGQNAKNNVFLNLPYIDSVNRRIWFFESLDIGQGTAKDMILTLQDAHHHDIVTYGAHKARWTGEFWRLTGVKKIVYGVNGEVQSQTTYEELDLPDVTTPPRQLSLIVSQPDQLTLAQLSEFIATSTSSADNLAKYRTEWWYRVLYPFSLIVLMLFALLQATRTDRRSQVAGVIWAVIVLIVYVVLMNIFIGLGNHNRLPPFVAVIAMEVVFGAIGLQLLALHNGWWWQLLEVGQRWQAQWAEREEKTE